MDKGTRHSSSASTSRLRLRGHKRKGRPTPPGEPAGWDDLGWVARNGKADDGPVLVVSLGLFGSAVALALEELNVEVLAIDDNPEHVAKYADDLTYVVEMDSTDYEALDQIGVANFSRAVVALSHIEKSIMTVLALSEAGVGEIWARAATRQHGEILERIGAHHVIYSERSTGRRVAHAISSYMTDFFEFEHGFAMAVTRAPSFMWGLTVTQAGVRANYQVAIAGTRRAGGDFVFADFDAVVEKGDEVIVCGTNERVEAFCRGR